MAVKDLVSGVLAESITTSTTNILVTIAQNIGASGIQAFFPTPPFYITIMPKSPIVGVANRLDSEIIQVTAVGHDQVGNAALTGVRGQRDTTAKAFSAGDIVTVGVYTDDAVLLGGTGTTETETPWIDTNDIVDDAVTVDKIDWSTITLGETHHLTLNTNLPFTAYNGTNYVLSVQNEKFSGGTYLLTFPSVIMFVSSLNYQAHINYRIDGGTDQQICSWAHWANQQQGTQTATIPINIPAGTHTVEIGFGTNSTDKQLQVYGYQTLDAWVVKIGG